MSFDTFYSIIYLKPYAGSDERLNLALFLSDGKRMLFDFSEERVQLISKLVGQTSKESIQGILRSLKESILTNSNELNNLIHAQTWSESYLSYLSRYSTNLIGVTVPKSIKIEVNQDNFIQLFHKWISTIDKKELSKNVVIEERLSGFIHHSLEKLTNVNLKLNESIIPGILFPFTISSIGKNENPFMCEFLDFDMNLQQAKNRINYTLQLNQVFSNNNMGKATIYFVANEPQNENLAHSIWNNLRDWSGVIIVSESDVKQIENFMEEHDVKPLIS